MMTTASRMSASFKRLHEILNDFGSPILPRLVELAHPRTAAVFDGTQFAAMVAESVDNLERRLSVVMVLWDRVTGDRNALAGLFPNDSSHVAVLCDRSRLLDYETHHEVAGMGGHEEYEVYEVCIPADPDNVPITARPQRLTTILPSRSEPGAKASRTSVMPTQLRQLVEWSPGDVRIPVYHGSYPRPPAPPSKPAPPAPAEPPIYRPFTGLPDSGLTLVGVVSMVGLPMPEVTRWHVMLSQDATRPGVLLRQPEAAPRPNTTTTTQGAIPIPAVPVGGEPKAPDGATTCSICMERPRCVAWTPCGHRSVCKTCARDLVAENTHRKPRCPVCREEVTGAVEVFDS
jgi:hypothetical protein